MGFEADRLEWSSRKEPSRREIKERVMRLLKHIEWSGPADYSIGVKTCPWCGRRGNVRKESEWYEGHSEECELGNLMNDLIDLGD